MLSGVAGLFLSAVAGYWVLERAETHKGDLKRIGQFLGVLIIVASLVGVACRVWSAATCQPGSMGKGWYCPYSPRSSPLPPASQ